MPVRAAPAPGAGAATGALAGFSEPTASWFRDAFAEPTAAQADAWNAIGNGQNALVVAPTGSGKTLAAFLWAIDKLATEPVPASAAERCRVLYISPLKALAVDIERNLRSPLAGVSQAMRRLGLPEPQIRVGVRTGDTAADERRKLAGKPPDILITTPESLFLLLTSRAREGLRHVQTVIIDEVHALAGGKRGAHLALSLERLDALRGAGPAASRTDGGRTDGGRTDGGRVRPAQRIGLSATVRPPEEVASFLGGALPVTIAAPPSEKRLDLRIVVPVEDMADLASAAGPGSTEPVRAGPGPDARGGLLGPAEVAAQAGAGNPGGWVPAGPARAHSIWPHVEAQVLDAIEQHRSTIVFANSRRLAERLCARLNELAAEREPGWHAAPSRRAGPVRTSLPRWWPARTMDRCPVQSAPRSRRRSRPGGSRGGCHVEPRARHRHGRGRSCYTGRIAAVGGQRPAAHRPGRRTTSATSPAA